METIEKMKTIEATKYPLDFDALEKGDVIPVERLEHVTSEIRKTQEYALKLLVLRDQIMTHRRDVGDPIVVVGFNGEALRVLTDLEASAYGEQRCRVHMSGMRRNLRSLGEVDVSEFDELELHQHERRVEVWSKTFQAAQNGFRKAIKVLPYERNIPGLEDNSR